MSGGSLDYFFSSLEDHIGDFGDKELDELVKDLAQLFHDREWFLSCDTSAGDWNEARDAFKAKWFTELGRQERIEKYLADFVEEVRRSFGISTRYCKNCNNWTETVYDGKYVKCKYHTTCIMHRSETCEKWEERRADDG